MNHLGQSVCSPEPMLTRYRTIVADPPWNRPGGGRRTDARPGRRIRNRPGDLPYLTMTEEQIAALPVSEMAAADAHLYLWTINSRIEEAYRLVRGWGFRPAVLLVWRKRDSAVLGGTFKITTEFVLFARRGNEIANATEPRTCFEWPTIGHSVKPDAFYDLVERTSPGPYAELFSRRARFGWDYPIGDQSLGGVAA